MKDFLMTTYSIILPIFMGYVVWMLKRQGIVRDANAQGTMLLLRIQLIEYHDRYTELGYIPNYVYENYVDLWRAYHNMNGNGLGDKMMEEVKELEIRNHKKGDFYDVRKNKTLG